jgi:hypothetical protein
LRVKLKDSYKVVKPRPFVLQSITIALFYVRIRGVDSEHYGSYRFTSRNRVHIVKIVLLFGRILRIHITKWLITVLNSKHTFRAQCLTFGCLATEGNI